MRRKWKDAKGMQERQWCNGKVLVFVDSTERHQGPALIEGVYKAFV